MSFAHTFGTGGPDVELLLVAVAALAMAIVFFFSKTTKPIVPVVLLLAAFALGAGAFTLGRPAATRAAPDVAVEITEPRAGATVPAGRPFKLAVEVRGGELTTEVQSTDPTKGHLHVFVDEELISMPATTTPELELEPGDHEIAVEFTGADHRQFSPRIIDRVPVTADS